MKKTKVYLLGDSIRQIGYGTKLAEVLGDDYEVSQPQENGRFAKYTLRMLFDHKNEIAGSDVIHWNNGLWDDCDLFGDGAFTSIEDYIKDMVRIAKILKTYAPKVIFATTTPRLGVDVDVEKEYNAAIVPVLEEMGIQINDLYSVVKPNIEEYIRQDDKIHLTEKGIMACAEKVAEAIKDALNRR